MPNLVMTHSFSKLTGQILLWTLQLSNSSSSSCQENWSLKDSFDRGSFPDHFLSDFWWFSLDVTLTFGIWSGGCMWKKIKLFARLILLKGKLKIMDQLAPLFSALSPLIVSKGIIMNWHNRKLYSNAFQTLGIQWSKYLHNQSSQNRQLQKKGCQ